MKTVHGLGFALLVFLGACAEPGFVPPPVATAPVEEPVVEQAPQVVYPGTPEFEADKILIALLAPRSGQHARLGEALMNAAELALFDARDPRITVKAYDTQATPAIAAQAAAQAVEDGAHVILGPLFSTSVRAVGPIAQNADIPVLAFSNDANAADEGVYLLGFQPAQEVERIIEFAAKDNELKRFAALIPQGAYGETVLRAFGGEVVKQGAEVRAIEIYERNTQAMTEPVKTIADYDRRASWLRQEREFLEDLNDDMGNELLEKLENQETLLQPEYDAILLAEGGQLLRTLAPLLAIYEVDPTQIKFLGTGLFNDLGLTREPPLHGAWFAAPPAEGFAAFSKRYRDVFGRAPARISALAYDAMAMTAILAREPVVADRFSQGAITNPNGFAGIDGIFRFRANGIAERKLAILEIQPEGFVTISPAATSFERQDDFLLN